MKIIAARGGGKLPAATRFYTTFAGKVSMLCVRSRYEARVLRVEQSELERMVENRRLGRGILLSTRG